MGVIAADAAAFTIGVGRRAGNAGIVVIEGNALVDEIADCLNPRCTGPGMAEELPGEIEQALTVAEPTPQQEDEAFLRQLFNGNLASVEVMASLIGHGGQAPFSAAVLFRAMRVTLLSVVGVAVEPALPQALVGAGRGASLSDALEGAADIYGLPRVPRPHGRTATRAGLLRTTLLSDEFLPCVAVHRAVGPHRVQHDGELPRHRDDRAPAALRPGQPRSELAQRR